MRTCFLWSLPGMINPEPEYPINLPPSLLGCYHHGQENGPGVLHPDMQLPHSDVCVLFSHSPFLGIVAFLSLGEVCIGPDVSPLWIPFHPSDILKFPFNRLSYDMPSSFSPGHQNHH